MKEIVYTANDTHGKKFTYDDLYDERYVEFYDIEILSTNTQYGVISNMTPIIIDGENKYIKSCIDFNASMIIHYIFK